jgi:hypothetical protein
MELVTHYGKQIGAPKLVPTMYGARVRSSPTKGVPRWSGVLESWAIRTREGLIDSENRESTENLLLP